ncbi:DUF4230 domain-containing protein [Chryseobacterium sp. MFBS3-17]|uniref:DUF4230 domain-containing protein n=1 Tax=Chryseobacterium sp. MFBS3-17 TaxID=2886689 RepID=UPI001D0EDFE1|nr:DUF4230 domain-containing protein [Chryseobacterium sp. MFBS3-17]MCC2591649.1 DUF4230 domain-containing protein [Chryseobacterium sp. MFBS3-17]
MKNTEIIKGIVIGAAAVLLITWLVQSLSGVAAEKTDNSYQILRNQITKMNKMVVLEQDFSTIQKTSVAFELLGNKISENEIIAFTKTNAQVSYDLNKMVIEVDSLDRKLIIRNLPDAEIRITPSVEIQSIDDSFLNRIDDSQIKKVTQSAKDDAVKRVDQTRLRSEGRKQLMDNLNNIFILAKALNYSVVDETKTISLSELSRL